MKVLPNSPRCLSLVATEERFILLAAERNGTINVRRIAWCDREDPEQWTPQARTRQVVELQTDGAIAAEYVCARSDADPDHYGRARRAVLWAPSGLRLPAGRQELRGDLDRAAAATGAGAFWMGRDGFYRYDGSAVRELPCEVNDEVFRFMDTSFPQNVYAVANASSMRSCGSTAAGV